MAPTGIVMVGYGYWGPNIVRNVVDRSEFRLRGLCELDAGRAAEFERRHPDVPVREFDDVLLDPRVSAVAIATPPRTHYALARRALLAGKHVLVEKPLATTSEDAEELVRLAERADRVLMPGHTFIYSPAVNKVRDLIRSGELGDVYFITSSRMNLGLYQADGVICDLAPHDLSILLHWLEEPVRTVAASGRSILQPGVPETAFMTVTFNSGVTANVQLSWLAPRKVRQMVVVGSRRMVVLRGHFRRRGRTHLRPRPGLQQRGGPVLLRRVPAHLPLRRHGGAAPGARRAALARARGLRADRPRRRGSEIIGGAGARGRRCARGRARLAG